MSIPPNPNSASVTHPYMRSSAPKFAYIDDGEDPKLLSDDELYTEIMECGVPLLDLLGLMARGYQYGNPVAVLSKAIATAACDVPDASIITGIGDKPIPLNFLFCLVGPSGLGKGLTLSAPIFTHKPLSGYRSVTPASGEALIAEFFETVPAADGKGVETQRHSDPVMASWGEIDAFAAKSGNSNSTLDAIMRSLWTGESAGDTSIYRKKSGMGCVLEAGSYRFVMFVGAQPDHAGVLLQDATGGTLQRLLWMPLWDDDAPETMAEVDSYKRRLEQFLRSAPGSFTDRCPNVSVWGPRGAITVSSSIRDQITMDRGRVLRRKEDVDPLDSHKNNLRLRLAAVFAGWTAGVSGDVVVSDDAWWWAGCVIEYSKRTREHCVEAADGAKKKMSRDAGKDDAERSMAREAAIIEAEREKTDKLSLRIIGYMEQHRKVSRRELSQAVTWSGNRKLLDKALQLAMDSGDVSFNSVGRMTEYVYTGKH